MDCFGTYFTHVQSCNVIYRRRRRRPPVRPSASLYMTCIDVYRRRETSRDIDKIYRRRRRRRRPGLRPSAPPACIDVYRRRETWRDIDKIYRRRRRRRRPAHAPIRAAYTIHVSTSIDVARHRETSIKSIVVVVVALVCAHPRLLHVSMSIDVARHGETSIKSIDVVVVVVVALLMRPSAPPILYMYRRLSTSRDIERHR